MSEVAAYSVRLAKPNLADRSRFLRLWKAFMIEHRGAGADLEPTETNLLEFLHIYDSYTAGSLFGMALLATAGPEGEAVGVLLGGEDPPNWRFESPDRVATLWGVYVVPGWRRQGVGWALQGEAVKEALRQGFTRVRSLVLEGYTVGEANAFGWGARKRASVVEHSLVDPYGKERSDGAW